MRFAAVALVLVVSSTVPSPSDAEDFGGWRFESPGGTRSVDGDHVVFTKITGKTFCQFAMFPARPPTDADVAYEWKTIVEKNFTPSNVTKPFSGSTSNVGFVSTSATLTHKTGSSFAGTQVVIAAPGAPGAVSSVLITSTNNESLAQCPTKAFIDSIVLVQAPGPARPAAPPAQAQPAQVQPAQPAATTTEGPPIASAWGTAASSYNMGMSTGSISRQYTFKPDGTYRYYQESWGGHYNANWYYVVDESGTWKLAGDKLSVTPKRATSTEYNDQKKKVAKLPLEKTTYTVQTTYMSGMQEWYLILTTPKETKRDGSYSSSDRFKSSYMLSNSFRANWKFPPP